MDLLPRLADHSTVVNLMMRHDGVAGPFGAKTTPG